MKLAIHNSKQDFHPIWIEYCKENDIPFKLVNCYDTNIIDQLKDCDVLLWNHHHTNPKDVLFAKQLLFSLEQSGKIVFPDFNTGWHFDDKLGQKYLFEALNLPLIPSYVFYDKKTAKEWANTTTYPKVWKLRGGAGASNVKLVKNKNEAFFLINKAFNKGFSQYNAIGSLKERWRQFISKKGSVKNLAKGVIRLLYPPYYAKVMGREIGYIYFQDFIPNNKTDFRIKIVNNRCWGFQRKVRANDFRASGSGDLIFDNTQVPESMIKMAYKVYNKLQLQSVAFDFVLLNEQPLIVEISYGFGMDIEEVKNGYWTSDLNFHKEVFNPHGWIIESVIEQVKRKNAN